MTDPKLKSLFGSTCRIEILKHYFENPYGEFYIREITGLLKQHMNNVRRELANLQKIGILKKVSRGRMIYYVLKEDSEIVRDLAKVFGYNLTPTK
jgi:Fic family protein